MTIKYYDVLVKLDKTIRADLANEQMKALATLLREREDREIDRILEDKGSLRTILRSYYQ